MGAAIIHGHLINTSGGRYPKFRIGESTALFQMKPCFRMSLFIWQRMIEYTTSKDCVHISTHH